MKPMSDTPRTCTECGFPMDTPERAHAFIHQQAEALIEHRKLLPRLRELERELAAAIREREEMHRALVNWRLHTGCDTCFEAHQVICNLQDDVVGLTRDLDDAKAHFAQAAQSHMDSDAYAGALVAEVESIGSLSASDIRLFAGEMTAGEMRTAKAVLAYVHTRMCAIAKNPAPAANAYTASTESDAADVVGPVAGGGTEFHVWEQRSEDDIEFVAQVNGPRDQALTEARHYARQVGSTAIIEEVTRREVERRTMVEREAPALRQRVLDSIRTFRGKGPEDGESWESWYFAAFDLLTAEICDMPADSSPAQPMAMLPNSHHPGPRCSCRDCLRDYPDQPEAPANAKALVRRLRDTPNWLRESWGGTWKNTTTHYDRAPFEAADMIERLSSREEYAQCHSEGPEAAHPISASSDI